jgi:alcohol dehydrogenase class IV
VDPELTYGLPPAVTASTGLDALTQLIEPYVGARANPITDALCVDGIRRVAAALPRAYADGADRGARCEMSLGSLYGGLALANSGLGVVHGFAAPVGGMWPAPHGAVCAAVLPHGMAANIRALRARGPEEALRRYEIVARVLLGRDDAQAEDGVDWVRRICDDLRIPPLSTYGVTREDVPALVGKVTRASSTKGNPVVLTEQELTNVALGAI